MNINLMFRALEADGHTDRPDHHLQASVMLRFDEAESDLTACLSIT